MATKNSFCYLPFSSLPDSLANHILPSGFSKLEPTIPKKKKQNGGEFVLMEALAAATSSPQGRHQLWYPLPHPTISAVNGSSVDWVWGVIPAVFLCTAFVVDFVVPAFFMVFSFFLDLAL